MRPEQEVEPQKRHHPILGTQAFKARGQKQDKQPTEDPVWLLPISPDQKQVFKVQVWVHCFLRHHPKKSFKILLEGL